MATAGENFVEKGRSPVERRTCLLIAGMHRSGTSALTRVLNLLGCGLPVDLVGAGSGNEAGHWEPRSLVLFNDKLLASAGCRWDDWQQLNPKWYDSVAYESFKAQARDLLNAEFMDHPLFVFKDPRVPQMLPFWLDVLEAENIETKLIVPIRHPDEVAASLEMRDMMEAGYGRLLWLRRVLDAEHDSRGHSRIFCTYEQLLRDWRPLIQSVESGLNIALPRRSALIELDVDKSLREDMRHQFAKRSDIWGEDGVSQWLQRTYALLNGWSNHGEDHQDFKKLDNIRAEFNTASRQFASLILPGSRSGEAGEGSRQLGALRAEVEELSRDLTAQVDLIQSRQDEFSQLSVEHDKIKAENESLKSEIGAKDHALYAHEAESRAHQEAMHQAKVEKDRLEEQFALTQNILRQREEEIAQTLAELALQKTITEDVGLLQDRLADSEKWVFKLAADRRFAEKVAEDATNDRDRVYRSVVSKENENKVLKFQLETYGNELNTSKESLAAVSAAYAHVQAEMRDISTNASELKARLSVRHAEIAQLTRILIEKEDCVDDLRTDLLWSLGIIKHLSNHPAWWRFLPKKWKQKKVSTRLAKADLFDSESYLNRYPDVAAAGMDPLQHYLLHGMDEGRSRFPNK
ncbi:hypothetical protein BH11PSE5_BH11PSE5_06490 [soil metagenome]